MQIKDINIAKWLAISLVLFMFFIFPIIFVFLKGKVVRGECATHAQLPNLHGMERFIPDEAENIEFECAPFRCSLEALCSVSEERFIEFAKRHDLKAVEINKPVNFSQILGSSLPLNYGWKIASNGVMAQRGDFAKNRFEFIAVYDRDKKMAFIAHITD